MPLASSSLPDPPWTLVWTLAGVRSLNLGDSERFCGQTWRVGFGATDSRGALPVTACPPPALRVLISPDA